MNRPKRAHDRGPTRGALRSTRGFSLIEVVGASVGMAILFAASLSLLSLIAGTMPSRASASSPAAIVPAAMELDRLCERLAGAVEIEKTSERSFRFRLEDQNGDGTDEWFVYSWSGVPGEPLMLARNGLPSLAVIGGVRSLSVGLGLAAATAPAVSFEQLSDATLIDGLSSLPAQNYDTRLTSQTGFHIAPNLQPGTIRWSIDTVRLYFVDLDADESLTVELREDNQFGFPLGDLIERWEISDLNITADWLELDQRNTPEFAPDAQVGLLLVAGDLTNAPMMRIAMSQGIANVMSSNALLGNWLPAPGIQPTLSIIGRETASVTGTGEARSVVDVVTIDIEVGDAGAPRSLTRRVLMERRPEVTP